MSGVLRDQVRIARRRGGIGSFCFHAGYGVTAMTRRSGSGAALILSLWITGCQGLSQENSWLHGDVTVGFGPARYRVPAPAEDHVSTVEYPVFGPCAGLDDTDPTMRVMEWVAKRTWHHLGLPFERKDFEGPPNLRVRHEDGWVVVDGTITDGGVPARNQIISAEVRQQDEPLLMTLRCTDAFGEVLLEIDLRQGWIRARSVTVSRTMVGGQSHSSPMPEQSSWRIITEGEFSPVTADTVTLKVKAVGEIVTVWADGREILTFVDPDVAGGKFGFGSTGTMRFRNVSQWELISLHEKRRREACLEDMLRFSRKIDAHYDDDVRARNEVKRVGDRIVWSWLSTGATAMFEAVGPRVVAKVGAGLYGNDTLIEGVFPEVIVKAKDGSTYRPDPAAGAKLDGDDLGIRMTLPLRNEGGRTATAHVLARTSVVNVWFWTVTVEGVEPQHIEAYLALAGEFRMDESALAKAPDAMFGIKPEVGKAIMRHNGKSGVYVKAIAPANTVLGVRAEGDGELAIATTNPKLRFASAFLPAQKLNLIGFKHRMVHFIRYPEGPIQHWRRKPSFQEYPTNVDLARFAGHGTDAMVWHHTWVSEDYRDREGFFVNHEEMKRAMNETHRRGMKMIGYLGIVPGRNPLLRYEDTVPLGGKNAYGGYEKNWDLQDHTFYSVGGRYPFFIAWMADYWCKKYDIDGFYLDGGAFGQGVMGRLDMPWRPEDADLTVDELQHHAYWRVKKVLELNGAGYGLEPWSGLNWLINGFYDCMMIGESFQEAAPDYYRDGHNALLTGCTVKMYGMRASSQNPYNIAMAAVNLSDIQVCSGNGEFMQNGAWGNQADRTDTWARVRPLWDILDGIDWDNLVDARPWYAQELVSGEGFYAGNYTEPKRAIVFLANRTEEAGTFEVFIDPAKLPANTGGWRMRYILGREGDLGVLGDGRLKVELPALHDGPIGIEVSAVE